MATWVGLSQISLALLNSVTPKTHDSAKITYIEISVTSCVIAKFVFKFINFRYCSNKGLFGSRLNDSEIADPKTLKYGAKIWHVSKMLGDL